MARTIFSPYRICPLGAHIDHQGGMVLANTIHRGTMLTYTPLETPELWITSKELGEKKCSIADEIDMTHWIRYAQAATRVLPELKRGIRAHVTGTLVGAGLSSSASIGLAYLKALADVNSIDVSDNDLVQLDFTLENRFLGLQNGTLDPLSIVNGSKNALLLMDMSDNSVTVIGDPPRNDAEWIVIYSGCSRELVKSGYNNRVQECRQAAALLKTGAAILSEVSRDEFEERKDSIPPPLRRRAEHYFGEVERVKKGVQAWKDGDVAQFGHLMNESCTSSIEKYESGSEIIIELYNLIKETRGIYGCRFSGGGYGGCIIALAAKDCAESASTEILLKFRQLHPELPSMTFIATIVDGLTFYQDIKEQVSA